MRIYREKGIRVLFTQQQTGDLLVGAFKGARFYSNIWSTSVRENKITILSEEMNIWEERRERQ